MPVRISMDRHLQRRLRMRNGHPRILFVCMANINRSQIAAAVFNKLSGSHMATSAGIAPKPGSVGMPIWKDSHNPIIPLRDAGYNLVGARVRRLNARMVGQADMVVLLFDKKKHGDILPAYLRRFRALEWWDVQSISDDTTIEEYRRLERRRIKLIERLVKDLYRRVA